MYTYVIKSNQNTMQSGAHDVTCSVVANRKQRGYSFTEVQAVSSKAAAEQFDLDEQLAERGIKCTHSCGCTKSFGI